MGARAVQRVIVHAEGPPRPTARHDHTSVSQGSALRVNGRTGPPGRPPMGSSPRRHRWLSTVTSVVRLSRDRVRNRDLVVLASSLTLFGAIAVVPLVLVAVALAGDLTSPARMVELGSGLRRALPQTLGAPDLVGSVVASGLRLGFVNIVVALVPITVYGEGLRRVLLRLQGPGPGGGRDSGTSWRGRVAVLPMVVAAPGLLLLLLLSAGAIADLQDRGGAVATTAAGVLGYYSVLGIVLGPVAWTFRVVVAGRVRWRTLAVGSFLTAASLAGFVQGVVLFLALPLPLGAPFGGMTVVGAVVAAVLWGFLLHLVLLAGWVLTLSIDQQAA